jgi:hypothetical protein
LRELKNSPIFLNLLPFNLLALRDGGERKDKKEKK